MNRTYDELVSIPTYIDRFRYLQLNGTVGASTFGYERYLNQVLYNSYRWRKFREKVIIRDNGCDLGFDGYDISEHIIIHHINPLSIQDVMGESPLVFSLQNVICVSAMTHKAIHYGDESLLPRDPIIRSKYDTCPWKCARR